ncbi:MAG: HK97 gp10 family phage protein [Mycobacteriales bacterium]
MARYNPNRAGVRAWLDSDENLRNAVRGRANEIAGRARVLAPVRTGRYKASIKVRDSRGWDGRVAADVTADAPYSVVVEVGRRDVHNRGHHTLRRAAETL